MKVKDILRHVGVNLKAEEFYITGIRTNPFFRKYILRVEFDSPDPVEIAMSNAKKLKLFDKYEVSIANDLTYHERARLRAKVQQLKIKRDWQPEIYWTIKEGRIVSLGPRKLPETADGKTDLKRIQPSNTCDTDNEGEKFIPTPRKLSYASDNEW